MLLPTNLQKIISRRKFENNGLKYFISHDYSFQDNERILVDSDSNENADRQTWIVISTPGLNDWTKEKCPVTENKNTTHAESSMANHNKRSLDKSEEPMDCAESVAKKEKVDTGSSDAGPSQMKEESKRPTMVSKDHILNFPIPNEDGKACIVKVSMMILSSIEIYYGTLKFRMQFDN